MTDLGAFPGDYLSAAVGVNSSGEVVGTSYFSDGHGMTANHPFLYRHGRMMPLSSLLPANSGWVLTQVTGINEAGQITGYGNNPLHQQRGFLLTPHGGRHAIGFEDASLLDPGSARTALTQPAPQTPGVPSRLTAGSETRAAQVAPPEFRPRDVVRAHNERSWEATSRNHTDSIRWVVQSGDGPDTSLSDPLAGNMLGG